MIVEMTEDEESGSDCLMGLQLDCELSVEPVEVLGSHRVVAVRPQQRPHEPAANRTTIYFHVVMFATTKNPDKQIAKIDHRK